MSVSNMAYFVGMQLKHMFSGKRFYRLYILVALFLLNVAFVETKATFSWVLLAPLFILGSALGNMSQIKQEWRAFKINQTLNPDVISFKALEFEAFVLSQYAMVRKVLQYILVEYNQEVLNKLESLPTPMSTIYDPLSWMGSDAISKAYGSVIRKIAKDPYQEKEISDLFVSYVDTRILAEMSAEEVRNINRYNQSIYNVMVDQCLNFFQQMINAHQNKNLVISERTLTPSQYAVAKGYANFAKNQEVRISQLRVQPM